MEYLLGRFFCEREHLLPSATLDKNFHWELIGSCRNFEFSQGNPGYRLQWHIQTIEMSVIKWSFYKKLPVDIDKGQCNDSKVCQFETYGEKYGLSSG